jgi:hypothetical protein
MAGDVKTQVSVLGITVCGSPNVGAVEPPLRKAAWALSASGKDRAMGNNSQKKR